MKFCPTCQTRYDEEILRFCTKDGTPLVEENQPAFTEMPSESDADDFGEETVIRRSAPKTKITGDAGEITQRLSSAAPEISKPRIVIPTTNEPKIEPQSTVRARPAATTVYQTAPRRKSNTGKIVALTLLGTFLVLGSAALLYMMTRERSAAPVNQNQNVNAGGNFNSTNTNLSANLFVDNSSNFNASVNLSNANANVKTPTPKPTPTPTPASLSNVNNNVNAPAPTPRPTSSSTPLSPTPTPPTPRPSATIPAPPPPPSTPRPLPSSAPDNRAVSVPGILR